MQCILASNDSIQKRNTHRIIRVIAIGELDNTIPVSIVVTFRPALSTLHLRCNAAFQQIFCRQTSRTTRLAAIMWCDIPDTLAMARRPRWLVTAASPAAT